MNTLSYKTLSANSETVDKQWYTVDATDMPLGRLASVVAARLRGKHKADFTPHVDCGDNIIVLNSSKIKLSGNKWQDKVYLRYTEYPGGQRSLTAEQMFDKDPNRLIEKAVKNMLPKNKLGRKIFKNLYVYTDDHHLQGAQKPQELDITELI